MTQSWAVVDGVTSLLEEAVVPVTDVGFLRGWSVFETMELVPGQASDEHLARLERSCVEGRIPGFDAERLRREIEWVVAQVGGRCTVRATLTGSGHRVVTGSASVATRWHEAVRCARGVHVDDPFLPGFVKHGSRMGWELEVMRRGVDDVLRVADGRFTEGTRSGVLAVLDGVVWSHAHDGRILASTSVVRLLDHAAALGIPIRREGPPSDGGWDGLYIASSTRSIAPVVVLDGEALPGWDPVGRALAEADDQWRAQP